MMLDSALKEMENTGVSAFLDPGYPAETEKTIVVLGVARGGTSAIAGALDQLGIFMGSLAAGPVFEDVNLASAIEGDESERAKAVVEEYNAAHPVWGFKRPRLLYHLPEVHQLFRNPLYIIIFRDIFSAAQRTRISGGVDTFLTMKKLLKDTGRIVDFADSIRPNMLLVSYEKTLAKPAYLVDEIVRATNLNVSAESRQLAIDWIKPEPAAYLDATRTNKASGKILLCSEDSVSGWAKYNYPLKPAASVELIVNGEVVMTTLADIALTGDEVAKGVPVSANCGFKFELGDKQRLQPGDKISTRASEDILDFDYTTFLPTSQSGSQVFTARMMRWLRQRVTR